MNRWLQTSDDQLVAKLKSLVVRERELLHEIVEHICEVGRRNLHLARGYDSLAKYLIGEFGYSEPAAYRRVDAARLLEQVPKFSENLKDGSVTLTQVGELSRAIKEKQKASGQEVTAQKKASLIASISGLNVRQTQQVLAQRLDIEIKEQERHRVQQDSSVRVELTFSKETSEKLNRIKEHASHQLHQLQNGFSLATLVDFLADAYLEEHNISSAAESQRVEVGSVQTLEEVVPVTEVIREKSRFTKSSQTENILSFPRVGNRTLTPKARKFILKRDHCCQYVDQKTGRKCGTRMFLQNDHIQERWQGGGHDVHNLQVYCGPHNRYKHQQLKLGE